MLHRALGRGKGGAIRRHLITVNPLEEVDRPRRPEKEQRVLGINEVSRLLDAARGDRLETLYVLAIATGMRQGELLALRWRDVDLREGTVHVCRTLRQLRGRLEFGPPKTAAGRRRVDLPKSAVLSLEEHRRHLGAIPHGETLVFSDAKGGPIRKSNLLRRSFQPLLKRANLPRIRFHDLRHTSASLLLAQGVHPKVVQERLGHSEVGTTLNTYSHVLDGLQREAAEKLDTFLSSDGDAVRDGARVATRELHEPES